MPPPYRPGVALGLHFVRTLDAVSPAQFAERFGGSVGGAAMIMGKYAEAGWLQSSGYSPEEVFSLTPEGHALVEDFESEGVHVTEEEE